MQKFFAKELIEIGQLLGLIQLQMDPDPLPDFSLSATVSETSAAENAALLAVADGPSQLQRDFEHLKKPCGALEMEITTGLIETLIDDPPRTNREFLLFSNTLELELKSKRLLYIPKERAKYYENSDTLSAAARKAFPTAYSELREASTSYAVGRFTGAVLHAMRGVEVGVKALSRALGYNPPDLDQIDWHPILEKCESAIAAMKALPKGQQKEDEMRFYSQAALQFRYFKDGYRVQAAHMRPPFSDGEAKDIVNATIAFYEVLAKRLSESPNGAAS